MIFEKANFFQKKSPADQALYKMMKMNMSFLHITQARVHDINAMNDITYETNA